MCKVINCCIFCLCLLLLLSCNTPKPETEKQIVQNEANPPIVGGDSDEHGCKASAGYQWSALKKECIRIFESGIRLDAQAAYLDKSLSAFVVFASDSMKEQAEVYLPNQKESLLFNFDKAFNNGAGAWRLDSLTLFQKKDVYVMSNNKEVLLYQGHL